MKDIEGEMFFDTINGLLQSVTSEKALKESTEIGYIMKEEDYQRIRWLLNIEVETQYTIDDEVIVHDSVLCPHDHYILGNGDCLFRPYDVWWPANLRLAIHRLIDFLKEEKKAEDDED